MEKPEYAFSTFEQHYVKADVSKLRKKFVALEIGPGDSLSSALIAYAYGASRSILVDNGCWADTDMVVYDAMYNYLKEKKLLIPVLEKGITSLEELLDACSSNYYTDGLNSIKLLPDQSVDFIWSQAVLEHIKLAEFRDYMKELHRIIHHNGVCSHRIDLKDHLCGGLNNLRFSERIWESDFMSNSGFYTNRLRYNELLDIFHQTGFKTQVVHVDQWKSLPIPKVMLSNPFKQLSDDDLKVSGFDVILRPA